MIELPESLNTYKICEDNTDYFHAHDDIISRLVFGKVPNDADISIMVPAHSRFDTLRKTISSLNNLDCPENLKVVFVIVVNNPKFKLEDLGVNLDEKKFLVYVNEKDLGMVGNINRCCLLSLGKYIAFCHDDDVLCKDYLLSIVKHLPKLEKAGFACAVPNRYFHFPENKEFEAKTKKRHKMSRLAFLSHKKLRKVTYKECAKTWSNCFGGGPTCGVLFNREILLKTTGFPENFPYVFDYVFFVKFSFDHKIFLLNDYTSIYRMNLGASNRPEVQYDFFVGNLAILALLRDHVKFAKKYQNEMIYDSCYCRSEECIKMILKDFKIPKVSKLRYAIYKFKIIFNLFRLDLFRYNIVPDKLRGMM